MIKEKKVVPLSTYINEEGIEVEVFESIGGAESIKTKKQGRSANISDIVVRGRAEDMVRGKPWQRKSRYNDSQMNVMVGKMIRFKGTSDNQRKIAQDFLGKRGDIRLRTLVIKINSTLTRVYGNKYKNC